MKKDIFKGDKNNIPFINHSDAKSYITNNTYKTFIEHFENKKYSFPFSKYDMKSFNYYYNNLKKFTVFDNIIYLTNNKVINYLPNISFKIPALIKNLYFFKEPELINQSEQGTLIIELPDQYYYDIDIITNLFTEESRINAVACKGKINMMCLSPKEYWDNNKKELINNIINIKKKDINNRSLRDEIYYLSKEAALFRVTLAKSIYEIFKPKTILDFSSGWGDRLIASLTYDKNIKYYGFDPNTSLVDGYNKIINKFKTKNVIIKTEPFEKADISHIPPIDLAFTSPPYFNFEIYTDEATQSINNYSVYEDWLIKFLFVAIIKVFKLLKKDAYFVVHITNTSTMPNVSEFIMLFITEFLKGEYIGCILTKTSKTNMTSMKPLWVYKNTRKNISTGLFQKNYENIYDKVVEYFFNKKN